jgi:hypothetical protein
MPTAKSRDMRRSLFRCIIYAAIVLPLPSRGSTVQAPDQPTISIRLQTDRPAYVTGETMRVRFVVTNATGSPVEYDSETTPVVLKIIDGQGKPLHSTSDGHGPYVFRVSIGRVALSPGSTTLTTNDWQRGRVWRQWWDVRIFGYHLSWPGKYTMVADGSFGDSNVKASSPVTIQVLGAAAARVRPSDLLANAKINAMFGKLANEYARLRSDLIAVIALVRKGANWGDLQQKAPGWGQTRDDFQNQIDALSSSGNPKSPYVQVNANLENAAAGLGAAGDRAFQCDVPNAIADLAVADYFFDAVRGELSASKAGVGDASDPPPYASPDGYCKEPATPTSPPFLNTRGLPTLPPAGNSLIPVMFGGYQYPVSNWQEYYRVP